MGTLRLFLALCVIAGHAGKGTIAGVLGPNWSTYAVLVFFVISGFYMAMVMDTKYKHQPVSVFYISRAARIFPTYWLAGAVSAIFLISYLGADLFKAFSTLSVFQQIYIVFTNLFIFGQDLVYVFCMRDQIAGTCFGDTQVLFNPPGWSIAVELLFYAIAPFFVRSIGRSALLLGIGIAYFAATHYFDFAAIGQFLQNPRVTEATFKYYFFPASFIFFGSGACAYYAVYKPSTGQTKLSTPEYVTGLALVFIGANLAALMVAWWQLALIAMAVPSIFVATKFNRYDRLIGEMSYPVYMFHYPVLAICRTFHIGEGTIGLANAAALASIACGVVVHWLVDKPIDRWRHSLKSPSTDGARQAAAGAHAAAIS